MAPLVLRHIISLPSGPPVGLYILYIYTSPEHLWPGPVGPPRAGPKIQGLGPTGGRAGPKIQGLGPTGLPVGRAWA